MEKGIISNGAYRKRNLKKTCPNDANGLLQPPEKMIRPNIEAITSESSYNEFPSSEQLEAAAKNDMEWADNVLEGGSSGGKPEATIGWKEFKAKMIENISLFDGRLKNFGRESSTGYVVRVAKGSKQDALQIIRSIFTQNTDNIMIEEMVQGQGTMKFLADKPIKSGKKIVHVAKEHYKKEGTMPSGLSGTLTLLMEDKEQKYYGLSAGHVFIEKFEKDLLTKKMETCPYKCYERTVVWELEFKNPSYGSQRQNKILAEEVHAGVESFDDVFMDCGWFKVDANNMEYLDFGLENVDDDPKVCTDECLFKRNVCRISSLGPSAVDGVIVEDDVVWVLGEGEDNALLCGVFCVYGSGGPFAKAGNSGHVVHDRDGNVFGMVVAFDDRIKKYPEGVAVCIRLDQVLKYIEKNRGPTLQIAQQPMSIEKSDTDRNKHKADGSNLSASSDGLAKEGEAGSNPKTSSSMKDQDQATDIQEECEKLQIEKGKVKTDEDLQKVKELAKKIFKK